MVSPETEGVLQPKIVRGRVDSLSLYEITDYELQVLEEGSIGTTYLNFAIFFLSMAASFLAALLTATITSERTFLVFVVVIAVGFALGLVLGVLWLKTRRSMSKVLKRIRDRCVTPPPAAPEGHGSPAGGSETSAG